MQERILQDKENTKIYLKYEDGTKYEFDVTFRFMDLKQFYLAALTPPKFEKPKNNCPAEIVAYRPEGIYRAAVKIEEVHFTINEIVFVVTLPKKWDYKQSRTSSRKKVNLKFSLTFNDGFKIKAESYDLSTNGISFTVDKQLDALYTQICGDLVIYLPAKFKKKKMNVFAKYKRSYRTFENLHEKYCYVYKFIDFTKENTEILKMILMTTD